MPKKSEPPTHPFPPLLLLRLERGYTLRQLADLSGLSSAAISRIERGLDAPRAASILKLSKGLDVDPSEILDALEPHQRP